MGLFIKREERPRSMGVFSLYTHSFCDDTLAVSLGRGKERTFFGVPQGILPGEDVTRGLNLVQKA